MPYIYLLVPVADECIVAVAVIELPRLDSVVMDLLMVVMYTRGTVALLERLK